MDLGNLIEYWTAQLGLYKYYTEEGLRTLSDGFMFYLQTTAKERTQREVSLDAFSRDLLAYIQEIKPLGGLKPAQPTAFQLNTIDRILESSENGTLQLERIKRCSGSMGKSYTPGINSGDKTEKYVVHWNFKGDFPIMAVFAEWDEGTNFEMLTLFFSPHQITNTEQIKGSGFDICFSKSQNLKIGFYDNAKRIDFHTEFFDKGQTIEYRNTCYYLGCFESISTGREYHVYAQNENEQKQKRYLPLSSPKRLELMPQQIIEGI